MITTPVSPSVEAATRREFLALLGAAGLLTACGNGDDSTSTGTTRTIATARGPIQIPATPQRVLMLHELSNAIALGVVPLASRNVEREIASYPERADELRRVTDLGGGELSIEAVAALRPDLIYGRAGAWSEMYDQLSRIAPTVLYDNSGPGWRSGWDEDLLPFVATMLDREREATDVLARYRARCDEFRSRMGSRLDSLQVSAVYSLTDRFFTITRGSFVGDVLEDCGLRRPANQDLDGPRTVAAPNGDEDGQALEFSLERLREADGDVIFLSGDDVDAVKGNPLWTALNAVRNNRAFDVGNYWFVGSGPLDAEKVQNDLFRYLL